jgi:small basic protein (TIGR04137 family)
MSIHKSLIPVSKLRRHRNVLKRAERIETLKKEERWKDDQSVFGLVKVRNILAKVKAKVKAKAAEGEAAAAVAGAAAPASGTAAPAAKGAAPAKGAAAAKAAAPAKKDEKKK